VAVVSPFTHRVGALVTRQLIAADVNVSIAEAARRMAEADTGSLVAVDDRGTPVGIVTDSDLRRKVVATSGSLTEPLSSIMSSPVITIELDIPGMEAVQLMLQHGIHHLVLVDPTGRAVGVLADSDLLMASAERPLFLARRIERAQSLDELADARTAFPRAARFLLDGGVSAAMVGSLLAEANDRLARRLLDLAHAQVGPAPVPYSWLVMGSEGRREQTLRTDQDNGLVFVDDASAADAEYFARLANWMVTALESIGAPRCPGDMLASNPIWRGRVAEWHDRFTDWLHERGSEALLNALIAFDFRAVGGDLTLGNQLHTWLIAQTASAHRFLGHIAQAALQFGPPLNLFGRISVPGHGEHAGAFDVKHSAIQPVVDACRLLALEHGIAATATLSRLEAAQSTGAVPNEDALDIGSAFEALQALRLRAQLAALDARRAPDNYLTPKSLPRADRAALREHLHTVGRFQDAIRLRYAAQLRVG